MIGIAEPREGSWARLRALQYGRIGRHTLSRYLTHCIGVVLVLGLFFGKVPMLAMGAWVGAIAVALWNSSRIDSSLSDLDRRSMTRKEFYNQAIGIAGVGLAWSVPLFAFTLFGTEIDHLALWAIIALLITGSAIANAEIPLGSIAFSGTTGAFAIASFLSHGDWEIAVLVAAFVFVAVNGSLHVARTHLTARIAEFGVAEKNEVVSLLLREFEENEADWLWQIDTQRRVRSSSPRFAFALGATPDKIEGIQFIRLISGEAWETGQFPPSLHDLAERLKRRESFSNLVVQVDVAAGKRWWELSGTPMLDENGDFVGFRGVGSDVTEQRESDEKIAWLARYDTLTGLPNRLMLTEALGDAMRYAEQWRTRCAFLMIDLDRFKSVNDSLGHQVGDQLLAQVSDRLKSLMSNNEMCGRLGGDEFAIVIRDASDKERVGKVAQAAINKLSLPYEVDNHTLYVGASVGSAIGPRDGSTVEMLMRNADLALYRSKDDGGSVHFAYEPTLHADAEERRKLEVSLRHSLERNELRLNFQPVVDTIEETIVSFETLLRWHSEEHGVVSPGKFIPLAEETRLIVPIGEWVLRQACIEATNWPEHIKVAVNASGEQLLDSNFASSVVSALSGSGLDPRRLEIEVTESIFVRDDNAARSTLEQIMALGCSVALDDFGTGYSSLGYLRKMRFSTIKVDRSFVQGAAQGNRESLAIIRAVVAMAESLEMTTTAEGVETSAEAKLIKDLGCNKIQGFYFGRPIPSSEVPELFLDARFNRGAAA